MLLKLFRIELFKTRHSLALFMMLACPLMVVLLNTAMLIKGANFAKADQKMWTFYWIGNMAIWCYFMLPLLSRSLRAL